MINVFSLSPDAADSDFFGPGLGASNYSKWTGSPYLLDNAYHVVLYNEKDLKDRYNVDLSNGVYITEIGLPLHLAEGDEYVLTDEEISSFNVAITIKEISSDITRIDQQYIYDNYFVNGDFDINRDTTVTGVRRFNQINPGQENPDRYIFFEIEPFVYTNQTFLVFMYINGNPVDTGWSAGYFDSQGEQQEFLGFSSANVFGESSAVGTSNKLCLAFTEKKV